MSYPIPSYAAHIWVAGDHFCVGFPGTNGAREHVVEFPLTAKGLEVLATVLKSRDDREQTRWLATKGAPTGLDIERCLVNDKAYNEFLGRVERQREKAAVDLSDLDDFLNGVGL